jgi:hypothetical protein
VRLELKQRLERRRQQLSKQPKQQHPLQLNQALAVAAPVVVVAAVVAAIKKPKQDVAQPAALIEDHEITLALQQLLALVRLPLLLKGIQSQQTVRLAHKVKRRDQTIINQMPR